MIPAIALISGIIQLAPSLAKMFKGSEATQEAAEIAAKVARAVTGTEDNDSALAALQANPALLVEYQKALLQRESEIDALEVQDKSNARSRDIEFLHAGIRNYRADFLVGVSVLIILAVLAIVIAIPDVSEFAKGSLTTILGVFLNQLTNVFSFEFGTTKSSRETQSQLIQEYIKS